MFMPYKEDISETMQICVNVIQSSNGCGFDSDVEYAGPPCVAGGYLPPCKVMVNRNGPNVRVYGWSICTCFCVNPATN